MKRTFIRRDSAMTETLILIPLFLGMVCIIGWIGFLLIAKSKMEKHAWIIQTKQSYDQRVRARDLNTNYNLEDDFSWKQILQGSTTLLSDLPVAFKLYLTANTTKYKKLNLQGDVPEIIDHFYHAFLGDDGSVRDFSLETDLVVSGSAFDDDWILKQWLWREGMKESGFGVKYPLYILGLKELLRAAVPGGKLGGFSDLLNMSDHEMKLEAMQ